VRMDLLATLDGQGARLSHGVAQGVALRGQRLRDLARALPRLEALTAPSQQRFDLWAGRLGGALGAAAARKRARFDPLAALIRPRMLADLIARGDERLARQGQALGAGLERRVERAQDRLDRIAGRLQPALGRVFADAARNCARGRADLLALGARLKAAEGAQQAGRDRKLLALGRTLETLSYTNTLARGFAVVRGDGAVVTTRAEAEAAQVLEIEFKDGTMTPTPRAGRRAKAPDTPPGGQGSLF
jgi:exodeoxyribonuclease VII large subunit